MSGWIYQPQGRRFLQQVWCTKKKKSSVQQHSSTHSSGLPPQWTGEWWLLPNWNQTTYKNCGFTPSPPPLSVPLSVCLFPQLPRVSGFNHLSDSFHHTYSRGKKRGNKNSYFAQTNSSRVWEACLSNWWLGIFQMTSLWTVRVIVTHEDCISVFMNADYINRWWGEQTVLRWLAKQRDRYY